MSTDLSSINMQKNIIDRNVVSSKLLIKLIFNNVLKLEHQNKFDSLLMAFFHDMYRNRYFTRYSITF